MAEFLISLFYFVRPMMFIELSLTIAGINFFEFITIIFSLILAALAIRNVVGGNKLPLSDIEFIMLLFIVWCTVILIIFYEASSFKTYIKWILPFLTYMILKRTVVNKEQYLKTVYFIILGYIFPIIINFIYVYQGKGLEQVVFWTGLERYSGIYSGIHMMAHNMGFYIMLVTIFYVLIKDDLSIKTSTFKNVIIFIVITLALYGLYKSQTRTVYVGLLVFFMVWLFRYNKRLLMMFSGLALLLSLVMLPYLSTVFFDVVEAIEGKRNIEEAGSGRPIIWMHNLNIYSDLGIDRKIAGVGIGNTKSFIEGSGQVPGIKEVVWNSHNDYLEVLMETGAVGFVLQLILYVLIYKKIRKIKSNVSGVYEALFAAVVLMNILSNSYISRFGLAQLFFMVLVFIELPDNSIVGERKIKNEKNTGEGVYSNVRLRS